jgi:hypothetical protein
MAIRATNGIGRRSGFIERILSLQEAMKAIPFTLGYNVLD